MGSDCFSSWSLHTCYFSVQTLIQPNGYVALTFSVRWVPRSITCNYVGSVRRSFIFVLVLWIGCTILLWSSLCMVILIHSHFVFEGENMILIPPVPGHCFQFIFYGKEFTYVLYIICHFELSVVSHFGFKDSFGYDHNSS